MSKTDRTEHQSDNSAVIYFYSVKDLYGEFSNFAAFPIRLQEKLWPTSEHFFQAQKFADANYAEQIRATESPMTAAKMGRDRTHTLRPDWEAIKDDVMRMAVRAKLTQHPLSQNCSAPRDRLPSSSTRRMILTGPTAVTAAGRTCWAVF